MRAELRLNGAMLMLRQRYTADSEKWTFSSFSAPSGVVIALRLEPWFVLNDLRFAAQQLCLISAVAFACVTGYSIDRRGASVLTDILIQSCETAACH